MKKSKLILGVICVTVLLTNAFVGCSILEGLGGITPPDPDQSSSTPLPTIEVESVDLDKDTLDLIVGETTALTASISPVNATNKRVNWESSDSEVASVSSSGTVTALHAGTATITATASGKSASCTITVTAIDVTGIDIGATEHDLALGEQYLLSVSILPANASDKTVVWTTSDESVAIVKGGLVTALKAGTTVITATASSGLNAKCTFTVSGEEPDYATYIHIKTVEDYLNIAPGNGKYCLDNDIDFAGADVPCIGNYGNVSKKEFTGIFDGRGYSLLNAYFVSNGTSDAGVYNNSSCAMFYKLGKGSAVRNVNFIDCISEGTVYNSIITVWMDTSVIENCYVQGYVANNNDYWDGWTLGGMIACVIQGESKIRNCVVYSASAGITYGLVGSNYTKTPTVRAVENCYILTPEGKDPMNMVGEISADWSGGAQPIFDCYSLNAQEALTDSYSVLNPYYWQIEEGKVPYLRNPEGIERNYTGYTEKVVIIVEATKQIALSSGQKILKVELKPAGLQEALTFTSSDESVVKVSEDGILIPVSEGTATITISSESGAVATCTITVVA